MKKFLFLTGREWMIVLSIVLLSASATYLWFGYAKPICAIGPTPYGFIYEVSQGLQNGQHFTKDELAARYSSDTISSVYPLTFLGQDDHLILIFTPKSYDKGWGVHGSRFKYQFDTQSLKTRVYDEHGVCFYTHQ